MRLTQVLLCVLRYLNRPALFATLPLAVACVQAQSMSATYRAAAQAYRDAAAKSKSARNRSCYMAYANYNDCVAAQLGPNPPRSCTEPSCSFEPEPGGTATGGSSTPVNSNPIADTNRTMQEILDRNERDRQVAEQERREREEASEKQPVEMSPGGNNVLKDLNAGADAAAQLGLKDTNSGGELSGKDSDVAVFDDLSRHLQNDSDRPQAFLASEGPEDFNKREEELSGDKTDHFYRPGDPSLQDLYTPGATGNPEGWGILNSDQRIVDDIPSSIEFGPQGTTIVQYGDRSAIPKSIQFLGDGRSVIEYGSDANYSQGVTITSEHGRVTGVDGPLDNRVPTVITYDNSGRVITTQHGPPLPTSNQQPNVSNPPPPTNTSKPPPTSFVTEKSPKSPQPAPSNDAQAQEPNPPGVFAQMKDWIHRQKERFDNTRDSVKQWWNENLQRVASGWECAKDPFECVTHLGEASKEK